MLSDLEKIALIRQAHTVLDRLEESLRHQWFAEEEPQNEFPKAA